jgi:hypothetical protein
MILKEFPNEIGTTSATPAADYIFKVREEGMKHLPEWIRW